MDKSYAKIQFKKYIVKSIDFRINPAYEPDPDNKEVEIDISFNHALALDPNEKEAELSLLCEISKDYEERNRPFFVAVDIAGLFSYESELDPEEQNRLLLTNGSAILFPYLRATVNMITMLSGIPPFVLPTINIAHLIESGKQTP